MKRDAGPLANLPPAKKAHPHHRRRRRQLSLPRPGSQGTAASIMAEWTRCLHDIGDKRSQDSSRSKTRRAGRSHLALALRGSITRATGDREALWQNWAFHTFEPVSVLSARRICMRIYAGIR